MSRKHLHRYVNECAGTLNAGHNSMELLETMINGIIGKRLIFRQLVA